MQTERFNQLRKETLKNIFEKRSIIRIWRTIVKNQLRNLDLKDLYDHYDFNYNIVERAAIIRSDILNGTYKVGQPLVYRIEKKFGVCRHLVIPQPSDTLVLQVLVETIADKILARQPSENAFYSRAKYNSRPPYNSEEYGLTWKQQWKVLQKKIYAFNKTVVVTDLSNYYDSIDINELRKVFTSYAQIDEVLVDLLFRLVEEISWKPDYLPYSGRGLPTTNIEGIRLLAHSFLFELDNVLKARTSDNFTRWMDDITVGVENKKVAIETISIISDMLKSRGLALNLAKTNIYNEKEAHFHFQISENNYLDTVQKTPKDAPDLQITLRQLKKKFRHHLRDKTPKYWSKVSKRYITTFAQFNSLNLLSLVPGIYLENPEIRSNLLFYLSQIGFNSKSASCVIKILSHLDVYDDVSLYQLCHLTTQWQIPNTSQSRIFIDKVQKHFIRFSSHKKIPSHFYCILWFKAKYDDPTALLTFISIYENIWQSDSFLRRQVTAILSRLLLTNADKVVRYFFSQFSSGVPSIVTLANQIVQFSKIKEIDNKLSFYLFPPQKQSPYPLNKFLVLCSVLNAKLIRENDVIKQKVKSHINDPYYLRWLSEQYGIT